MNPKTAKPGELMQKAKHFKPRAKHKVAKMGGDMPSMSGWRPTKGGFNYPQPKTQTAMKPMMKKKKMTQKQDDAYDTKHGIKENSKRDIKQDAKNGIMDKKSKMHKTMCKSCKKSHPAGKHMKSTSSKKK